MFLIRLKNKPFSGFDKVLSGTSVPIIWRGGFGSQTTRSSDQTGAPASPVRRESKNGFISSSAEEAWLKRHILMFKRRARRKSRSRLSFSEDEDVRSSNNRRRADAVHNLTGAILSARLKENSQMRSIYLNYFS